MDETYSREQLSTVDYPKPCPICAHVNSGVVAKCARCGRRLTPETTQPINELTAQWVEQGRPSIEDFLENHLAPDQIAFVIGDSHKPLIETGRRKLVLGRRNRAIPHQPMDSLVDLTWHFASALGVSRTHAAIDYRNDRYVLIDLGSINGTWLKEQKLRPNHPHELNSKDVLQLGLMRVSVHFSLSAT